MLEEKKRNRVFGIAFLLLLVIGSVIYWRNFSRADQRWSIYKGKRAVVFGDCRMPVTYWVNGLIDCTPMQFSNQAATGTLVAQLNGHGVTDLQNDFSLCNMVEMIPLQGYDYCFLSYGIDDFECATEIGDVSYEGKNTFCGALRYSIERIREQSPDIEIFFIQEPAQSVNRYNARGERIADYYMAVDAMANEMDFHVINTQQMVLEAAYGTEEYWQRCGKKIVSAFLKGKYKKETLPWNYADIGTADTLFEIDADGSIFITPGETVYSKIALILMRNTTYELTFSYEAEGNTGFQVDFFDGTEIVAMNTASLEKGVHTVSVKLRTKFFDDGKITGIRIANSSESFELRISQLKLSMIVE